MSIANQDLLAFELYACVQGFFIYYDGTLYFLRSYNLSAILLFFYFTLEHAWSKCHGRPLMR